MADKRRNLLLVEDEPLVGDAVQRLIEKTAPQWAVTQARSFAELLLAIQRQRPDLLLLDLNLPDMQGTVTLMSALTAVPNTAIVVITGDETETQRANCLAVGAIGFIGKSALTSHPEGVAATLETAYLKQKKWQELLGEH
jgi:two-component system, NarL family, sensor histidine kinase FusK